MTIKRYLILKHQLHNEKELKELCEGVFKKEDGTPLIQYEKDDILFEVLKLSELKKEIENRGRIDTLSYIEDLLDNENVEKDWQQFKKKLGVE